MQQMAQQSVCQMLLSYSPDLAPSDFHLFEPLKQHLGGRRFHSNGEVEMAVRERLRMQEPDLYLDGIFKLVPKSDKCIDVLGYCVEK
jgi:histone-lysine N-methyltransferase SETMAR